MASGLEMVRNIKHQGSAEWELEQGPGNELVKFEQGSSVYDVSGALETHGAYSKHASSVYIKCVSCMQFYQCRTCMNGV